MSDLKEKILKIELLKKTIQEEERSVQLLREQSYNEQIKDVNPEKVLQECSDIFMTSDNRMKLHNFIQQFSWLKLDLVYEKTNTYCLQVKMDKDQSFEEFYSEVSQFIPFLVCVPNIFERPFPISGLHIKIVDKYLGDEGSISIVKPDHESSVLVTRNYDGIFTVISKHDCFYNALHFCYENFAF